MPNEKKTLTKIKSGALSRGVSLAKLSLGIGARAAGHAMSGFLGSDVNESERFKALLLSQFELLSRELGQLKGSVMKVGQMLSVYGEHFFPPEVNAVLKNLQSQAPPLAWVEIEKVLVAELGPKLQDLEVDPEPTASASLGQVHRARRKSDGAELALKVQFPGVDQAIEGDLKALKYVFSATKLIPKGPKYDALFGEIREMLRQEMDYGQELQAMNEFREQLKAHPAYLVPEPIAGYSTRRVLCTSFEGGVAVDGPEVRALSQERRSGIGFAAFELYLMELFRFGMMQTDPHFGNYRIRLAKEGEKDRLVLYDFGAVKRFDPEFLKHYRLMTRGACFRKPEWIIEGARGLHFIREEDSEELKKTFIEFCFLFSEPFSGVYDWGASNLPKRVAAEGARLALTFKLRAPPKDVVFLDRKMAGVFIFLSVLGVKADASSLLKTYLL